MPRKLLTQDDLKEAMKSFFNDLGTKKIKRAPTAQEIHHKKQIAYAQKVMNASAGPGYNIDLTALTDIVARVTEQTFFEIRPSEFMPVRVGQGAWSEELITYRGYQTSEDFESGLIDTGTNNARQTMADIAFDSVPIKVFTWDRGVQWTIAEMAKAQKANSWDIVTRKEQARKKSWDLGIQKIAFLGGTSIPGLRGLLTLDAAETLTTAERNSKIKIDTALLGTEHLNAKTPEQLNTFVKNLIDTYRSNCDRTAWPNKFLIPESVYLGLGGTVNPDFPIKSILDFMKESFISLTGRADFEVRGCAYADTAHSDGLLSKDRYILYNSAEDTIRLDIPIDYSTTTSSTFTGFNFQNVAFGQFTGLGVYRPKEVLYLETA